MYWLILVRRIWSNDRKSEERERERKKEMHLGRKTMKTNGVHCRKGKKFIVGAVERGGEVDRM